MTVASRSLWMPLRGRIRKLCECFALPDSTSAFDFIDGVDILGYSIISSEIIAGSNPRHFSKTYHISVNVTESDDGALKKVKIFGR